MGAITQPRSISTAYFHPTLGLNPSLFGRCLKEIKFPADKQQLVDYAKSNKVPANVITLLQDFSDRNYRNAIDLFKEFWRVEPFR